MEQLEEVRAKKAGQVRARRALNEEQRAAYEALRVTILMINQCDMIFF